jgi:hypothetical protein
VPDLLREKARMPRAVHGDEWPKGFGGMRPQSNLAFSLEEAPTFGRGSSLDLRIRMTQGTRRRQSWLEWPIYRRSIKRS